ncbi:hypothetical protein DPMN_051491 [Dreissena polymorpha]|uniref:Uncharacterized protein n=1 Tax=Dreissena polymorpha TaxID=45954 RepID=A0A9D4CIN5_DREPO|nr:hypothetical protein DPMN_051491 [Dreissena polymorpha]
MNNKWPPGGHVFQQTGTIFELVQDIIWTNLLTKFHEDPTIKFASTVLTRQIFMIYNGRQTIDKILYAHKDCHHGQNIIGSNLLTKFHEDRKINVASRVLTRKNAPPPGDNVFQPNGIIFELIQDIIGMNLLTNVASRVKNAPPLGSNVFQAKVTIFELIQDISGTNLLGKFHEDQKINVASRVLTRKNAPPPGGHVFQPTGIIFELVQDIIGMNLLTKKNAPPLGSHVFQANVTIFELIQDIIKTTLLTKFHEDWTINVASRELTRQMLTPHNAQRTTDKKRRCAQAQNIIGTNLLTKFHEDRKIIVASRVLTRKNAPPTVSHVFQPTGIIFELVQDIIGLNLLTKFHEDRTVNVASRVKNATPLGSHINLVTKFHEDWTINVTSRVLTRFTIENCPAPGGHVFKATKTIFELIQDIIGTNLLTKFHDDRKINVTSRVLTRFYYSHINKNAPPPWWPYIIGMNLLTEIHDDQTINVASRVKNAPPLGSHVFQAKVTIFKLIQDIIGTNLQTKFYEDRKNVASRVLIRKNAPPPGGHVFQPTGIIFDLVQDIIGMNLLTKFHEDWTINVDSRVKNAPPLGSHTNLMSKFHEDRKINVASRVLTRKQGTKLKNAPPLGSHVFQAKVTIFKLIQDISGTNLLIKFDKDRKNVASRVLIRKNAPPPDGHVFQPTGIIFDLVQDIIGINLLTKFHEDWTINVASRVKNAPPLCSHTNLLSKFHEDRKINVASRVLTRKNAQPPCGHFHEDQTINVTSRVKNAPPLGSHVFQANVIIFELIQDIIQTNLLTKFHEDWTIHVASSELTRQMLTAHNARRTKSDHVVLR